MTTLLSSTRNDWYNRITKLVLATISLYCLSAIVQDDAMADNNKYLKEQATPRKALVITAGNYINLDPLPSANQDGVKISEKLKALGFSDVIESFNEPAVEIWKKIRIFQKTLEEGDLAVVYLSGHGFQWQGLNYFAPVDARHELLESTNDLTASVIPISDILQRLSDMKVGLGFVILDACRNNSLIVRSTEGKQKSVEEGLGPQVKPQDVEVLIAYAANYGQTSIAYKDPNKTSLYTKYFLENVGNPGQDIIEILRHTRTALRIDCSCQQDPRIDSGSATFYPNPNEDNSKMVRESWIKAYDSQDASLINEFLIEWPVSEYSSSARRWLADNSSKVSFGNTFKIDEKSYFFGPSDVYVEQGKNLAAPIVAPTSYEDKSKGKIAFVAKDSLKVFSQSNVLSDQIATLRTGEIVRVLESNYDKNKTSERSALWSKILLKNGEKGHIVGYVKDAIRIDEYSQYSYVIKLKPTNKIDLLEDKVLVSVLGGEKLSSPMLLNDAIVSKSSGRLNRSALAQSHILVKLYNFIEGAGSAPVAKQMTFLKAMQIRQALINLGAKAENVFIKRPAFFPDNNEGKPDGDEITFFLQNDTH